ncbi:hypothetical protein [Streptomyces sp. NBC_01233]|uniref:hypothetical protein n=1 Tax=Streptomyces sp. NBC_01233 TaxID=2903787 RepID=UPI002E10BC43|nr:hypothetical protein OG332_01990 [Streptomyces sp. NBC_01233]
MGGRLQSQFRHLMRVAVSVRGPRRTRSSRSTGSPSGSASATRAYAPCLTEHIKRFGEYSTHELGIEPDAYDPKLDVDFTLLREGDLNVVGLDRAA